MVAALTMESPDSTGKLSASPPVGGKVVSAKPVILPPQSVAGKLRVLLAGGGSSHDFAKWFDGYDQKILKDTGSIITAYTSDPLSVAEQLPNAEVFILSANDAAYQQKSEFRETLEAFTKRGGGLVLLHPATWQNWALWPKYNTTFVGGGAKSHDTYGAFRVKVRDARHPVMEGVPASFELTDELYHVELNAAAKPIVLCETSISNKTNQFHPCVWITPHASARIVCIALGHDAAAHQNPQFQRLLINAVQWTAAQH